MSIATERGDSGKTDLVGGVRVSKSDLRVEAYGTVDELNSVLGFARSICTHGEIAAATLAIQKTLFGVGAVLATPGEGRKKDSPLCKEDVDALTAQVHRIEAQEGILSDWSIPGAQTESSAYEMARTVCRRAERCIVRLVESGEEVHPLALAYLNRLSDLLWLFARQIDVAAGVDSRLREGNSGSGRWSRAW